MIWKVELWQRCCSSCASAPPLCGSLPLSSPRPSAPSSTSRPRWSRQPTRQEAFRGAPPVNRMGMFWRDRSVVTGPVKKPRGNSRGCLFLCISSRFVATVTRNSVIAKASNAGNWLILSAREEFTRDVIFLKVILICQTTGYGDWFSVTGELSGRC